MAIFDTTEHIQTAKQAGKDHQLTPSPTEAKDAQAYFDDIIKNDKAHSTLPKLTFNVVPRKANDETSYYSLEEVSAGANGHKTVVELARFQEYTNGLKATHKMEHTTNPSGAKILRETDQVSNPTSMSVQVSEAPDDGVPRVRKEMYRKVSDLKDGQEVASVTVNYVYSEKTGKPNSETIVSHNADGSGITQVFGGEDKLRLNSEVDTGPDGKETQRATTVDVLNDQKQVIGRRETVVQRKTDSTVTTTFDGPDDQNLKVSEQTVAYDNGTTETYKPDKEGKLKLVNSTKAKS
jgi:hypothetical protein